MTAISVGHLLGIGEGEEGAVMRIRGALKVGDVMTKVPCCCKETDTVRHAAELMRSHDVGSLPVVNNCEERKLLGIVTDRDICLKIVGAGKASSSHVADAMKKSVTTSHVDDLLEACEEKMERHQVRRVPVVDSHGVCVGIVAQADIALHDSAEHTSETVAAISKRHARREPPEAVLIVGAA